MRKTPLIIFLCFMLTISSCNTLPTDEVTVPTEEVAAPTEKVAAPMEEGATPTEEVADFIIRTSCPEFISSNEADLGAGKIIFNSKYPDTLQDDDSVVILDANTREIQEGWINQYVTPSVHNISPDNSMYLYFDNELILHISSVNGQEFPIAYWDTSWGKAVNWFDNKRLYIRPKDEWRNGVLIILDPSTGSWERIQNTFPSGLNSFFPYVSYNKDLSVGLYICGDNFCLWNVNSDIDISRFESSSVYFSWRLPERDLVAMKISDAMYEGVGELMVINEKGRSVLSTNFGEAFPQSDIRDIQEISWSPDGKRIAIALSLEELALGTLMIIDLETMSAVDYCIQVPLYSNIVWSPDSSRILVTRPIVIDEYLKTVYTTEQQRSEVVLVDIEKSYATIIFEDTVATGWMVLPVR